MRAIRMGLLALLLPLVARSQAAPPKAPPPPPPSPPPHPAPPSYRGFTPGPSYRAFVDRANALAAPDVLACRTSPRTAPPTGGGRGIPAPAPVPTRAPRAPELPGVHPRAQLPRVRRPGQRPGRP